MTPPETAALLFQYLMPAFAAHSGMAILALTSRLPVMTPLLAKSLPSTLLILTACPNAQLQKVLN